VVLGLLNLAVGRQFLFFLSQLQYLSATLAGGGAHGWWTPWETTIENAVPYLAPLVVLSVVSAIEIARLLYLSRRSKRQEWAVALHGLYLFYFAVCVIGQNAGQTLLQPRYMAYPIWEMWILAVVAVIGVRLPSRSLKRLSYAEIASLASLSVGGALWLIFGSALLGRLPWWLFSPSAIAVVIGCAYLIFFFVVVAQASWYRSVLAFTLLFPILNMLTGANDLYVYSIQPCPYGREGNEILVRISQFATSYAGGKPERAYLWLDEHEPLRNGVDCPRIIKDIPMGFVGYSLIGFMHKTVDTPFPIKPLSHLSNDAMREAITNGVVVIISNEFNNMAAMQSRYSSLGIMTQLIASQRFQGRTLDLTVYILQQKSRSDSG